MSLNDDHVLGGKSPAGLLADADYVQGVRSQMLKFARLQLGDAHAAEDAVQEALAGALTNVHRFEGRAALKSWVFGILKNKIGDELRQRGRLVNASSLLKDDEDAGKVEALFDAGGWWQPAHRPMHWDEPGEALARRQFWIVFEACLDDLPPAQARVFMMREFVDLTTAEIRAATGVTSENLYMLLHRARLRLRECLEQRWFMREASRA